jgi:hypothetical protein
MRAILIAPEKRTVTEVEIAVEDYRDIQKVLGCRSFTTGAHLRGSLETGFDTVFVSDDELEDDDVPRFWFQIDATHTPPSSYPIAGLGIALGVDRNGATCDVGIRDDELRPRVTFTQRKIRGFETSVTGTGLVVDVKAPVIDGTEEGETRGGAHDHDPRALGRPPDAADG